MNELAERAFAGDPDLAGIRGYVEDSGEGRWTVQEAIDLDVPAPITTLSLLTRFRSRQLESYDHASYRDVVKRALQEFSGPDFDAKLWDRFGRRLFYLTGDFTAPATYAGLQALLRSAEVSMPEGCGLLFYLAIPPSVYPGVIDQLSATGIAPR